MLIRVKKQMNFLIKNSVTLAICLCNTIKSNVVFIKKYGLISLFNDNNAELDGKAAEIWSVAYEP